jgi:hypothetical protein
MNKYTLGAGRFIVKDGRNIAYIGRAFDGVAWELSPADTDILAHRIVNALNHMELIRKRKAVKHAR